MHDFIRKPKNWAAVCVVVCFLFALLYSFLSAAQQNLPSYVPPDVTAAVQESKTPDIETREYRNEELGLSMLVPADWQQVIQRGNPTFINQVDAATIQFIFSDYTPTLNAITEDTVRYDVEQAGGVLGGYAQQDVSSYLAIYEINSVDFFEYTTWDLDTSARVSIQIPAARYKDYYDVVIYLLETLNWTKANPIPDGFGLFYSSFGNFEFGVPIDWAANIVDGSYVATSQKTGAYITCSVTENTVGISTLSQLDYVDIMSKSKPGYLLSMYSNAGNTLTAEASYTNNGEAWQNVHYLYFSGSYLYEFSIDCPQSAYKSDGTTFLTAVKLFRCFE